MRKKINKELPVSPLFYDEKFQMDEYHERQRIIAMLNKGDIVKPEEPHCDPGDHYILISDIGVPQCADCLTHFTWEGVHKELLASTLSEMQALQRYRELRKVARQVDNGKPPRNTICVNDYHYLTGEGYRYIHRWFYERD
jgi:hypothetical protein